VGAARPGARLSRRLQGSLDGKLIAAARQWALGDGGGADDDAIADAWRDGWPEEEIDALRHELAATLPGYRLWAMHGRAFLALEAGRTQWRTGLVAVAAGLATRILGLDYAGLKVALDALGLTLLPHEWRQLTVLERAAAQAMNGEQPNGSLGHGA
jgi:hypothetical protein